MELEPQISPSSRLFSTAQLLHVAAFMKSAAILTLVMRMHSSNRNRSQETVHPIYNIRWASFWMIWIWDSEPHKKKQILFSARSGPMSAPAMDAADDDMLIDLLSYECPFTGKKEQLE